MPSFKRLAVVVDAFPRWSERFIARELRELRRCGVELSVFCFKAGELPDATDLDWDGLVERRVVLPSCVVPIGGSSFGTGPAMLRRQALVREQLGLRAYAKIRCASALMDLLRDGGFEHVHAHFANLPSTVAWLAATGAKIPFSVSVHARDLFIEPQLLAEKIADASQIFCCHERAQKHLEPLADDKAVLMHHGLPLGDYPLIHRDREPEMPTRVLAAGRFVAKKGFVNLIDAFALPDLLEKDVRLTLVGDGPERKRLERRARNRGVADRVRFEEPRTGAGLRKLFDESHVFVAPYQSAEDGDSDGVPNVVLEAFALGLPVVGTQAGGVGEVLNGETGIVVAEKDPAQLSAGITRVLADPASGLARAAKARALVEEGYDIRRNITPLIELLTKK